MNIRFARNLLLSLSMLSAISVAYADDDPPKIDNASSESAAHDESPDSSKKDKDDKREDAKEELLEGLWPSDRMRDLMLQRWAEDICDQFEIEGEQRPKIRESVVKEWSSFLEVNRSKIQPLVNEFIEMRLELEPPTKEHVQEWSEKAMPVFDKFRSKIRDGQKEFREILPFVQRAKFEVEALKFEAGMAFAETKLKQWKSGEFEAKDFWEPTRTERRRRRAEREKTSETESKPVEPQDQIALELKRWEEYVAEFAKTYSLDDGQRDAAGSCLSELRNRALAHRDRKKEDIDRLEDRIKNTTSSPEERTELKKQLVELYGPVDDMFKELKNRLEQIPSTAQRENVAKKPEEKKAG